MWKWIELGLIITAFILCLVFLVPSCGGSIIAVLPIIAWFRDWARRNGV